MFHEISRRTRTGPEVNSGSMADIAFLLLIFFLLTTTIFYDAGILVKLPPFNKDPVFSHPPAKNVLAIHINADNQLLIEGQPGQVEQLKKTAIEFITNPGQSPNLPSNPKKAIISLQNDRGTKYSTYIEVYNELRAAYNEIWENESLKRFGTSFEALPSSYQRLIRADFPLVISEAEATEYE
jgi:biopolymer transport protein ExbD